MSTITKFLDLEKAAKEGTWFGRRYAQFRRNTEWSDVPPLPRFLMVEVANICNHKCLFCAHPSMERTKSIIDRNLFKRLSSEAYELGCREIGLHSGAEPLACKYLEELIAHCRDTGFEYIYLTTNGSLADNDRWDRLIDAGINSIKISVNAGNAETYEQVHGRNDFAKVIDGIKHLAKRRESLDRHLKLLISFVEVEENRKSFDELVREIGHLVDDILVSPAVNQSGQRTDLPPEKIDRCHLPFKRLHISVEGYMRVCCNDYENYLAVGDLNKSSIKDVWGGDVFRDIRRRHIEGRLEGTLCDNCVNGSDATPAPLNRALCETAASK